MLLFRSEEHLDGWLRQRSLKLGHSMTVDQQWRLADLWYRDRLSSEWRRRTPGEAQDVFARCGLTGPFWQLPQPQA